MTQTSHSQSSVSDGIRDVYRNRVWNHPTAKKATSTSCKRKKRKEKRRHTHTQNKRGTHDRVATHKNRGTHNSVSFSTTVLRESPDSPPYGETCYNSSNTSPTGPSFFFGAAILFFWGLTGRFHTRTTLETWRSRLYPCLASNDNTPVRTSERELVVATVPQKQVVTPTLQLLDPCRSGRTSSARTRYILTPFRKTRDTPQYILSIVVCKHDRNKRRANMLPSPRH